MEPIVYNTPQYGFYGVYYPQPFGVRAAMIVLLGDGRLARSGAQWVHALGCSVLAMAPARHDESHHNYPLESFGAAIALLRQTGHRKIGVLGASATGMLALLAASYYPDISLTVALTPADFVMEGFYQEDRMERPGDGESSASWQGRPLPYLPYAYRHPEYWSALKREGRTTRNLLASRQLFDRSEALCPLREEMMIPVEKITGRVVVVGAEDDCLWDTCRYIRRMHRRLDARPHNALWSYLLYDHGTHFVFPQSLLTRMIPLASTLFTALVFRSARKYPAACKAARTDIDFRLSSAILEWAK